MGNHAGKHSQKEKARKKSLNAVLKETRQFLGSTPVVTIDEIVKARPETTKAELQRLPGRWEPGKSLAAMSDAARKVTFPVPFGTPGTYSYLYYPSEKKRT